MLAVHVTVLFGGGARRFAEDASRELYVQTLGDAVRRTDWRVLSYCLLDDRIHLGFEAGDTPVDQVLQPLHAAVARRWRRRGARVFERRYELALAHDPQFAGHMISFHHNEPVRAGAARTAWDSGWSSHLAYLRLAPRPPWLAVVRGLTLSGLADDAAGRAKFDELTHRRSLITREHWLSPEYVTLCAAGKRTLLRAPAATPVPLRTTDTEPQETPGFLQEPIPVPVTRERAIPVPSRGSW